MERALDRLPASHRFPLVDIGVNLMDKSFDKDREAVLERAQLAGCTVSVITGSCLRTTAAAAAFTDQYAGPHQLYFTAGVHPHNAKVRAAADGR